VLDIKWIRDNPEAFVKGLSDRGFDDPKAALNRILSLDEERRTTIQKLQEAQASANALSKAIGQAMQAKDQARADALKQEVAGLKSVIQQGEADEREADAKLRYELERIPNMPAADVPVGPDADANVELRKVGKPRDFTFQPKQHFELGEALGLMDFETAAKLSGARFVVLKGALARLERALSQFMLDLHTSEHGYTEINPPLLVRGPAMFGTAQLPKFSQDQFMALSSVVPPDLEARLEKIARVREEQEVEREKLKDIESGLETALKADLQRLLDKELANAMIGALGEVFRNARDSQEEIKKLRRESDAHFGLLANQSWLIPTAEVPLTNLVREEIVEEASLPMRVTAGTPCFRAEAGAAGKDTRGMIRQHQFNKVELVSVTTPEQSAAEHERMTACAETVLKRLDIPYRTVVLSTGDMGFAAQKTYDIEVWLPGQGAYREISSCSNCGDFQARRMNARYKPKGAKDTRFVHTLNGSGVAVGRALIAVLENYQEEDGSIRIPDALLPYTGGLTKIEQAAR